MTFASETSGEVLLSGADPASGITIVEPSAIMWEAEAL
ncbi:MAG: hypothetical protein RL529_1191 [Actinomycetota bacterium]|jgi:hypothetical protein